MHWCLGIRGSGSTWVFNVVRKVALVLAPDRPILGPYVVRHVDLPELDDTAHLVIVKSHETDQAAAAALNDHAEAIWISIRDPRDCVASWVQYHDVPFEMALQSVKRDALFCARFTTHPRARLLRYEAGFTDEPATLDRIAAGFGGALTTSDRERIFAETRRPAIDAFIEQLDKLPTAVRPGPNDLVDIVTQWHSHHAHRTGEIGRWRHVLTQPQAAAIELQFEDWMGVFGYPTELVCSS
jgi:hypothetical protein